MKDETRLKNGTSNAISLNLYISKSSGMIWLGLDGDSESMERFGISTEKLYNLSSAFEIVARKILE